MREAPKSIFPLLLRRPGAPEAPRTLQKAPAGAKTICGASENAFLVPRVSLWGPPCQKKKFSATEKNILVYFAAWRPRQVQKTSLRLRKIVFRRPVAPEAPRRLQKAPAANKNSFGGFEKYFFGVQGLRRRPGGSKRLRRAQKIICRASENAFSAPGASPWAPPCKKKLFSD